MAGREQEWEEWPHHLGEEKGRRREEQRSRGAEEQDRRIKGEEKYRRKGDAPHFSAICCGTSLRLASLLSMVMQLLWITRKPGAIPPRCLSLCSECTVMCTGYCSLPIPPRCLLV